MACWASTLQRALTLVGASSAGFQRGVTCKARLGVLKGQGMVCEGGALQNLPAFSP